MALVDELAQGIAPPKFLTPQELQQLQYKNELARMQMMEAQQKVQTGQEEIQSRNALRELARDPHNMDQETGMPNKNAMLKLWQQDPDLAVRVQTNVNELARQKEAAQTLQVHRAAEQMGITEKQIGHVMETEVAAGDMYSRLKAQGVPEQEAIRQVSEQRNEQLNEKFRSVLITQEQRDRMIGTFNPVNNRAITVAMPQFREYLAGQKSAHEPPQTRMRIDNEIEIQEERDPATGTWKEIGRGPRFGKSVAPVQDEAATLNPDTLRFAAEQYLAGDKSVIANIGRGSQGSKNLVAFREEVTKVAKEKGMGAADVAAAIAEFEGVKAGERTLGTRTANFGMAGTEALKMADLVLEASDKFDRTSFQPVNKALAAFEKGTGDTKVREFGASVNSFINAYARAISPSGTPTVSDKDHARELLSTADSKEQVRAIIGQLKKEMDAAGQAPGTVKKEFRSSVTGTKVDPATQAERDVEAGRIRMQQAGGSIERAQQEIAHIDESLKGAKGSAVPILKQERRMWELGIEDAKKATAGAKGGKGGASAAGGKVVISSRAELQQAIADKRLKSGDTFFDPDGGQHQVK